MATFIQATSTDHEMLAAMLREFYIEEHLPFSEATLAAIERLLANPDLGRIFMVQQDSVVAGYFAVTFSFSLERGGNTALLDELYIKPTFRRQGLGKAALDFAIAFTRDAGCSTLLLEVAHANPAAQSLYSRLGFATLPRHYLTLRL